MGFETQEQAERWAENMEFRADQKREDRMIQPRLCRDCKHLRNGNCVHPVNLGDEIPDLVNGGVIHHPKWYGAQYCREDKKACGVDARWFEPAKKEPIV